eukprot:scaffold34524_cov38-Tisochrysis_lutea.AAC.2
MRARVWRANIEGEGFYDAPPTRETSLPDRLVSGPRKQRVPQIASNHNVPLRSYVPVLIRGMTARRSNEAANNGGLTCRRHLANLVAPPGLHQWRSSQWALRGRLCLELLPPTRCSPKMVTVARRLWASAATKGNGTLVASEATMGVGGDFV